MRGLDFYNLRYSAFCPARSALQRVWAISGVQAPRKGGNAAPARSLPIWVAFGGKDLSLLNTPLRASSVVFFAGRGAGLGVARFVTLLARAAVCVNRFATRPSTLTSQSTHGTGYDMFKLIVAAALAATFAGYLVHYYSQPAWTHLPVNTLGNIHCEVAAAADNMTCYERIQMLKRIDGVMAAYGVK